MTAGRTGILAKLGLALAAGLAFAQAASAQQFIPNVTYDPAIPTIESVLGKPAGDRITPSADIVKYFRALEAAAPDRIKVTSYAKSWQGRELVYAAIGSPHNISNLPKISMDLQALADPRRTSQSAADQIMARVPGTLWLGHGVHGDEISSSDSAMMTAYHMLAAQNDPVITRVMSNTLVFIDPIQNPDGRDRFVNGYYDTLGLEPQGSPISAERSQPWPGGRVNSYLFDMNRDWFALTQPETKARVAAFQKWYPLVFVDLHEMGSDETYYFSPEADPYNPDITQSQRAALDIIGRNNAKWFDEAGLLYFNREVFDDLYPGYGAGWPLFHGSIGTTYENASSRGLTARRSDGEDLTYAATVRKHFLASVATLETVSDNKDRLLRDFYAYRASAIDEGRRGKVRSYVIQPQADQSTADKLAKLLAAQGVEVKKAEGSARACGRSLPFGSYTVSLSQPAGRLAHTLMEEHVPIDPAFLAEQERRRAKDMQPELYDVTAWSLPLMYNLEVLTCGDEPSGSLTLLPAQPAPAMQSALPQANYGWLAPWGSTAAVKLLAAALREGVAVSSPDQAFTLGGRTYPAGTLIFRKSATPDLEAILTRLANETGAELEAANDSYVTSGPSFGSSNVAAHSAPRIAMAWDRPTSATAAGATRFVIERQIGYPVTPIRANNLSSPLLAQFDVLVLPDGFYSGALGEGAGKALAAWVERGGVLVALDGASRFVSDPKMGLSSLRRELATRDKDAPKAEKEDKATVPGVNITSADQRDDLETPLEEAPDSSPGALVRATTDRDHWLAAGVKPTLNVLMTGSDIYSPIRRDAGSNVISFAGPEDVLASGHLWEETKDQLAFKPFVTAESKGAGFVITFTQDPTTRAYMDGLNVIFANALFRAPAHARPAR
jgi:hypothetical protein